MSQKCHMTQFAKKNLQKMLEKLVGQKNSNHDFIKIYKVRLFVK